jgi:hypothetical protein
MQIPILNPEKHWVCPNCTQVHITREALPHTPFHACRGLKGLTAPFVEEGVKCKVAVNEREDYVGKEHPQYDGEGRPIMNVETTRDDGNDIAVLAPCAQAGLEIS